MENGKKYQQKVKIIDKNMEFFFWLHSIRNDEKMPKMALKPKKKMKIDFKIVKNVKRVFLP